MRFIAKFICVAIAIVIQSALIPTRADDLPNLPAPKAIAQGVQFYEVTLQRAGVAMKLWIYLPNSAPAGKLPCVLIAAAGTRLFHGIGLGEGDRAEHLPYASKGFAVIAYELDGALPENADGRQASDAIAAFRKSNAGIDNAKAALDYAKAKLPQIDLAKVYAVGHSSAATLALQVAQSDLRIAGCVAFAPACDLKERLAGVARLLDHVQPGTYAFLQQLSPDQNLAKLKCPTMLFTAEDDDNIPSASVAAFATELGKTNKQVKLVKAKSGGHYDSMIQLGIPAAEVWMKGLAEK